MPQVTDDLLDQMIQAIVTEVDPEQVILFGSRARGDAREDSDVDLARTLLLQAHRGKQCQSTPSQPAK